MGGMGNGEWGVGDFLVGSAGSVWREPMETNQTDYSFRLQELMQRVEIPSYRALSDRAGVSRWAINLLRQGKLERLRVDVLMRLSQTLAMPLSGLIARFFRVWRGSSQSFCFWGGLCSLDGIPRC